MKPPSPPPPPPPRPPPPPPPPSVEKVKTATVTAKVNRNKKAGTGSGRATGLGILLAGTAIVSFAVKDPNGNTPFSNLKAKIASFSKEQKLLQKQEQRKDIVQDFLNEEAKRDESISSFLKKKESSSEGTNLNKGADFRLDISRDGLKKTFLFFVRD
mmetsp:Transcript_10775/g.13475  ORF Transcript_10775/g.13475 Transcript_10775/m.13475 type:complete len:157 (-) Transcript_10775:112-582(-)